VRRHHFHSPVSLSFHLSFPYFFFSSFSSLPFFLLIKSSNWVWKLLQVFPDAQNTNASFCKWQEMHTHHQNYSSTSWCLRYLVPAKNPTNAIHELHHKRDSSRHCLLLTSLWSGQVPSPKVLRTPSSYSPKGKSSPCHSRWLRPLVTERDRPGAEKSPKFWKKLSKIFLTKNFRSQMQNLKLKPAFQKSQKQKKLKY